MRVLAALLAVPLLSPITHARCPSSATAAFFEPGRYGVAVRTLDLVDTSRPTAAHGDVPEQPSRMLTTEVWYPTAPHTGAPARDAAAAKGRFPLILNSHGYGDIRLGEAYVAEALASRGYVVASPDFPLTNLFSAPRDPVDVENQPADVRFVTNQVLALAKAKDSWLQGRIDGKARCSACHPAVAQFTDQAMHDLKVERFYDGRPEGPVKTFPLRGIKDSPPYLHDGRLLTLEDAVEFFNLVLGTQLATDEKADLVAYLRCL